MTAKVAVMNLSCNKPELLLICQRTEMHENEGESKEVTQKIETIIALHTFCSLLANQILHWLTYFCYRTRKSADLNS